MSAFANTNFGASDYEKFRPVYPSEFYDFLRSQFAGKPSLAVDLGCGTGQATVALAELADKVIGIDNSQTMVDQANKSHPQSNISFRVGNDSNFEQHFSPESIDLITVAEAAHYFDLPNFYPKAHKLLKKGGLLAIWAYYGQGVEGHPAVADIYEKYMDGEDLMGKYWSKGKQIVTEFYQNDKIPSDLFKNVVYHFNSSKNFGTNEVLEITKKMKLRDLINYCRTSSGYHSWLEANPELAKENDIVDAMLHEITEATGLTLDSDINVKWNTVYMLGRK